MSGTSHSIWRHNDLYVDAEVNENGDLTLRGQDLSGKLWAEYEYAITVKCDDIDTLIAALGGVSGDDVIDLLEVNAQTLITTGERRWLEDYSVPLELWSRVEPD
jgi:hypothetical protein